MRKTEVRKIVAQKYNAYRDRVIKTVKALPPDSRQGGDDSGLEDVWEEFKYQVQREESGTFDLFVETIEGICVCVAKKLPYHELELLWLDTDAYFDHHEGDAFPEPDELAEDVGHELYRKVLETACDEYLTFDPDEERQAAEFEDDLFSLESDTDQPRP